MLISVKGVSILEVAHLDLNLIRIVSKIFTLDIKLYASLWVPHGTSANHVGGVCKHGRINLLNAWPTILEYFCLGRLGVANRQAAIVVDNNIASRENARRSEAQPSAC